MDKIHHEIFEDALHTAISAEKSLIKAKLCIGILSCVVLIQAIWRRC